MKYEDIKELYEKFKQMPIPNLKHTKMTKNTITELITINELIEINEQLVQNNKIDGDTYHSILTRLESLKAESNWKMWCVFSITTELTMDIISDPDVKKGTTKIFVNPANLNYIMSREFNKLQK